jgi:hypothetical protein
MATPSIRCGMPSRRGETTRRQMANRFGKKSQASRAPADASVRRHRRAQGGSPMRRSIAPKRAALASKELPLRQLGTPDLWGRRGGGTSSPSPATAEPVPSPVSHGTTMWMVMSDRAVNVSERTRSPGRRHRSTRRQIRGDHRGPHLEASARRSIDPEVCPETTPGLVRSGDDRSLEQAGEVFLGEVGRLIRGMSTTSDQGVDADTSRPRTAPPARRGPRAWRDRPRR